jgi:purine catabolism regulator
MFDTKLVEVTDSGFAAITRLKVDDALLAGAERLGWRLVIGSATELSGLAEAYRRAWSLRGRVGTTGRSVRVDDVTWSVAGLLGKEAGAMLAARLLAPVLAQAPERRDALLGILRAWLGENGSWDATAKATGLHRNSIRRQIGLLAELLELDLSQAQARAELWIALQYTDGLPGMPPAPDARDTPDAPDAPDSGTGQLPQER